MYSLARAVRIALDCALPPERVLLALRGEPWPFALTGRWAGGGAIVGAAPREVVEDGGFDVLDRVPPARGEAVVGGGWFGWLGYGLGARVRQPPRPVALPDAHLAYYDHVLRLDADGQWWFEALSEKGLERLDHVRSLLSDAPEPRDPRVGTFTLRAPGAAGYTWAVRECVERIGAGEISQADLCLRLETAWDGDVAELYARAVAELRPAYGACFVAPWGGIASLSPELWHAGDGKAEAMHVISELEPTGREVYGGAIGYSSPIAGRELNVAIHTFQARDGALWLAAGSEITADSNPQLELETCLAKARPVVAAAGGEIEQDDREGGTLAARALSFGRRPDPGRGVFETILVRDGTPVNLEAHLRRFGARPELPALQGDGALRIADEITFRPLKPRELPIVLTPYLLPGGLGHRKWRDRTLLDALSQDGTTPLLIDADGTVLEAAWAAVLIRRGSELLTPIEDGRILPSTSRPPAHQTRLTLDDLERADEILLSSSLAGLVPAVLR